MHLSPHIPTRSMRSRRRDCDAQEVSPRSSLVSSLYEASIDFECRLNEVKRLAIVETLPRLKEDMKHRVDQLPILNKLDSRYPSPDRSQVIHMETKTKLRGTLHLIHAIILGCLIGGNIIHTVSKNVSSLPLSHSSIRSSFYSLY